jgi:hypothetical protein
MALDRWRNLKPSRGFATPIGFISTMRLQAREQRCARAFVQKSARQERTTTDARVEAILNEMPMVHALSRRCEALEEAVRAVHTLVEQSEAQRTHEATANGQQASSHDGRSPVVAAPVMQQYADSVLQQSANAMRPACGVRTYEGGRQGGSIRETKGTREAKDAAPRKLSTADFHTDRLPRRAPRNGCDHSLGMSGHGNGGAQVNGGGNEPVQSEMLEELISRGSLDVAGLVRVAAQAARLAAARAADESASMRSRV